MSLTKPRCSRTRRGLVRRGGGLVVRRAGLFMVEAHRGGTLLSPLRACGDRMNTPGCAATLTAGVLGKGRQRVRTVAPKD